MCRPSKRIAKFMFADRINLPLEVVNVLEIPEDVELPKDLVRQIKDTFRFLAMFSTLRVEFRNQREVSICD